MSWYNNWDDFRESFAPYVLAGGVLLGLGILAGRGCSCSPSKVVKPKQEPQKVTQTQTSKTDVKNMTIEDLAEGKENYAEGLSGMIELHNDNAEEYPYLFKPIPLETKKETVTVYIPGQPYPHPYPNPTPPKPPVPSNEYGPQHVPDHMTPGTTY